jgi:ABC-type multidrug transport system fused ATPase/permease subunit
MVDLLLRFHKPDKGRILLDGVDIRTLNLKQLRQAIAIVPQQVLLFDGTVADNIRYGKPDASMDEIVAAARRAQAEPFINNLPDAFETLIGDKGVRLSGGQRQRIALARALLKDPAILVLDEPTAMFDPRGERKFVEEARQALVGRTVILITHRPASLALADRIVTLEEGRIVADETAQPSERPSHAAQ